MLWRRFPRVQLIHNLAPFSGEFIKKEPIQSKARLYLLRYLTRISAKRSRGVIHLTEYARDYVRNHLNIEGVPQRVIYMGSDNPATESAGKSEILNRLGATGKLIFCCSHFYRYKNILELVRAFAILRQDRHSEDLNLVIAGEHYDRDYTDEIRAESAKLGIEDCTFLPGNLDSGMLTGLYGCCDLFVFPSTLESASLILLEALQAGAPIAASDTPLCREVLDQAGEYFDASDPWEMAGAMGRALDRSESLSEKSTERIEHFAWTRTASETHGFLTDIHSGTGCSATRRLSLVSRGKSTPDRNGATATPNEVEEKTD